MGERWTDPAYETVARLVNLRTGMEFGRSTARAAEAGITRAMSRAGVPDVNDFLSALQCGRIELADLVDELSVGETYFFRQAEHFRLIRDRLIGELPVTEAPATYRAWSAGCATGEEPYSLAILLDELGVLDRWTLTATDICGAALRLAQCASYGSRSLQEISLDRLCRYFQYDGDRMALDERIRRQVNFHRLNLVFDDYPSVATGTADCHLILCRNVLIYLDRESAHRVARSLFDSLAVGGWLLTSASDPDLTPFAPFERCFTEGGIVYRRPGRTCSPQAGVAGTMREQTRGQETRRRGDDPCRQALAESQEYFG